MILHLREVDAVALSIARRTGFDRDDAIQTARLAVLEQSRKFDNKRGDRKTWETMVARHKLRSHVRDWRKSWRTYGIEVPMSSVERKDSEPRQWGDHRYSDVDEVAGARADVARMVGTDKCASVVLAFVGAEMSFNDIARAAGVSDVTVAKWFRKGWARVLAKVPTAPRTFKRRPPMRHA